MKIFWFCIQIRLPTSTSNSPHHRKYMLIPNMTRLQNSINKNHSSQSIPILNQSNSLHKLTHQWSLFNQFTWIIVLSVWVITPNRKKTKKQIKVRGKIKIQTKANIAWYQTLVSRTSSQSPKIEQTTLKPIVS